MKVEKQASERAPWPDRLANRLKPDEAGAGSAGEPSGTADNAPEGLMIAPSPPPWPRIFPSL
jgi:hypothetical protein